MHTSSKYNITFLSPGSTRAGSWEGDFTLDGSAMKPEGVPISRIAMELLPDSVQLLKNEPQHVISNNVTL